MSEFTPKPQHEVDDVFASMVEVLVNEEPRQPSITEQQKILAEVQFHHTQQLNEADVMRVVVDRMPESLIGNNPQIEMRRIMHRHPAGGDITMAHVSVGHWAQRPDGSKVWQPMSIQIAQEQDGVVTPMQGFDQDQANLAMAQIHELTILKETGILPGLSPNLNKVIDPSVGLMSREQ